MAVSDRTRKMLWAQSGNRCVICRTELVQSIGEVYGNVIVGEECHIVSRKPNGPRGREKFVGNFDGYDNLILLCANDHKIIDKLTDRYSPERLSAFKALHESWVRLTLETKPETFQNEKLNIRTLRKITSGKGLLNLFSGSHQYLFDNCEFDNEQETVKVGELFQELHDFGDISDVVEIGDKIKWGFRLNTTIDELEEMGFMLFGEQYKVKVKFRSSSVIDDWYQTTLIVTRNDNPAIVGDFILAGFQKNAKVV